MIDTADLTQDGSISRAYAAWATKPSTMPGFIHRRTSGTMIRLQSGGLSNLALFLCALSITGLAAIALITRQ